MEIDDLQDDDSVSSSTFLVFVNNIVNNWDIMTPEEVDIKESPSKMDLSQEESESQIKEFEDVVKKVLKTGETSDLGARSLPLDKSDLDILDYFQDEKEYDSI